MKKLTPLFFVIHFSLFTFHLSEAQIIHVPDDYPTIQQGIDAAYPGDTVLVADGLYYEQISFLGKKPLMVASHYLVDADTNHLNNTIIDGSQLTDIDNASVVVFKTGEDSTSILCGFTIRGGKGTWDVVHNNRCGGGIYISGSGAKIIHNKVTSNMVDDTQSGSGQETYGGGIGTSHEDAGYWLIIEHNQIYNNSSVTKYGWSAGGGIYNSYNTRIANNIITENISLATTNGWGSGGGFSHIDLDGGDANTLIILNNKFHHNTAQSISGYGVDGAVTTVNACLIFTGNETIANIGITAVNGGGSGGISVIDPAEGCIVSGNIFRENLGTIDGGAIILENFSQVPNPSLVVISDNYFLNNQGTFGGAVRDNDIPVKFENNVFHGNQASQRGGAIYMVKSTNNSFVHFVTFINNSFSENSAMNAGGAIYSNNCMPLIFNSIFFNDSAGMDGPEIYLNHYLDTLDIAFSTIDQELIYGNVYDGGGNINGDPLFDDSELLTLLEESPCIDFGTQTYICRHGNIHLCPQFDILGIPRPQHNSFDIGAYESFGVGVADRSAGSSQFAVEVYPNPTSGIVDFHWTMGHGQWTILKVYNAQGQEVAVVLDNTLPAGEHTVRWDAGKLPAGIYYYRLRNKDPRLTTGTGKIVKY
jgi:predicted outer membrane repeat protein